MSDFTPITGAIDAAFASDATARLNGSASSRTSAPSADRVAPRAADAVELSDHALYLARLRELPEVRSELIERARQSIASGAYDSDAVIDATLDRLADDLDLLG